MAPLPGIPAGTSISFFAAPAPSCPRGHFHILPLLAVPCHLPPNPQQLMPLSQDPAGHTDAFSPALPPTSDLQQGAGHLLQCHHHTTPKVCIIDQRALIRIVLSVSELTGLGTRWGLTPSGCNFTHSGKPLFSPSRVSSCCMGPTWPV